jgi:hypothetical protein
VSLPVRRALIFLSTAGERSSAFGRVSSFGDLRADDGSLPGFTTKGIFTMKTRETTDAESFLSVMNVLATTQPKLPASAANRVALKVSEGRASLSDALRSEGIDLAGTTTATPRPAPAASFAASQTSLAAMQADNGERLARLESERTASVAPTAPATATIPDAPNDHDHVGAFPAAYEGNRFDLHRLAVAAVEKARLQGKSLSYRDAVARVSQ